MVYFDLAVELARKADQEIREGSYYQTCAHPKPELRRMAKKRLDKLDARDERAAREIVRKRDGGRCRIPNCNERSAHLHHIVYRSKSKRLRWDPRNLCSLCADHHALVHAGHIQIGGNADEAIIVTGNINALRRP